MAHELENGKISEAMRTWVKMFAGLGKIFLPFFVPFIIISLLGWIYGLIYSKLGLDKVIVSGIVMMIFYLGQISGNLKKLNSKGIKK